MSNCPKEHKFWSAISGQTVSTVWALIVCTACGDAQLKEFPLDAGDGFTAPVFFDSRSGQLVTLETKKERL